MMLVSFKKKKVKFPHSGINEGLLLQNFLQKLSNVKKPKKKLYLAITVLYIKQVNYFLTLWQHSG